MNYIWLQPINVTFLTMMISRAQLFSPLVGGFWRFAAVLVLVMGGAGWRAAAAARPAGRGVASSADALGSAGRGAAFLADASGSAERAAAVFADTAGPPVYQVKRLEGGVGVGGKRRKRA